MIAASRPGFDQDRLISLLGEYSGMSAPETAAAIESAVPLEEEPALQDDIAFMVVRIG